MYSHSWKISEKSALNDSLSFFALAEVAEMDDENLQKSLAEVYAHAANDPQHFREKAGDEPGRKATRYGANVL